MFEEGRLLCEKVLAEVDPASTEGKLLQGAIDAAGDPGRPPAARLAVLQDPALVAAMQAHPIRELVTIEGPYPAYADRPRALFGSWYEFFPRSEGATLAADGTRDDAAPSRPPPSGSTRSPRWASTSSTCRRSTRSARSTARAPTTR